MEALTFNNELYVKNIENITEKQLTCLKYFCNGYNYTQTAELLYLSPATVRSHAVELFRKLQVNNLTQLVLKAIKTGIVNI